MSAEHWLSKLTRRRKVSLTRVFPRRRSPMLEALENRLALTTVVGTSNDDTLVVSATGPDSGAYSLNGGPDVAFVGTTTFQFDGLGGNDLLRINNPAGALFAPSGGGISYNGGGQAGDSLENLGGAATSGSYSVGPGNGDGVLSHAGGAVTQTISFTGLAPITDTVIETTFTINATDAANTITLDDGTALGDGLLRVSIDTFEPIQFANKTNVVVDAGAGPGADGSDTINVVYTEVSTGLSTVTFNADDGGDFILVRATPTGVTTTANGDSGDDVFLFDSNGFAAGGTLNGILGPVTVNGGDNATLSTVSITTGCGVTTTLVLGDRILFTDVDNPAGQSSVYSLSDSLFQRISNTPGGTATGPLSFGTLERIDLLTGAGTDDILVSTTRDETTLIVSPGGGDDIVTVQNTGSGPAGAGSIVFVDSAGGADTIDVQATGANSAVLASGGTEDDVITLGNTGAASRVTLTGGNGGDTLNVRGTGANSRTEVNGGGGNDTINFGSAGNSLDTVQGFVCVAGDANDATPTVTQTVTCDGVTVSTTLPVGDTLNLNDQGDGDGNTYRLNGGRLERNGVINIFFGPPEEVLTVETINLNAGAESDNVILETTPDATTATVNAGPGLDIFTVQNTGSGPAGAASLTVINGQGGGDVIVVSATGAGSVMVVNGGDEVVAGDSITLTGNGAGSGVAIIGQGGADQINVFATTATSATVVTGGADNDQILVGGLATPLDFIQGVVCVDGQGDTGAGGDLLTLNDQSSQPGVGGAGNAYSIAASTVTRNGVARVTYEGIEQLALNAGQGSDTIDVMPGLATVVNIDGNLPTPPASPGDTLNVDTSGTTNPLLTSTSSADGFQGAYTFGNRQPVNFQEIETLANDTVITVNVDGNGKLTVEGTAQDDIVTITGVGTGTGVYIVTTQQGFQPAQAQTVTGVTSDICVNLHAGNDQLTMNNIYINGSIIVDMESGNDTVTLGDADVVSTRTDLDIDLGTENDVLNGRRIFIAGDQILAGGDGNDSMTFDGFASPFTLGTSAAGNANWSTGNGNDTVQVIYAFIVGAFTVDLGVGTDSLNIFGSAASGNVAFLGGVGNDSLSVDTNFFDASLLLDGGADSDTVFLANGLGIDVGTINTGAGDDTITVRNETQGRANIDTGSGDDTVDVRSSAVDRFFALMGDDDDELTLFGNLLRIEADLDGGAGSADRLIDLGNDGRGALRIRNFELFG